MTHINGNGNGPIYALTHPRTRQKAAEFKRARRNRPHSTKVTYEHLYRLFCNKDLTFVDIGRKVNLSGKTIHRIYEDSFRDIVSHESGTERLSGIMQRRRDKLIAEAQIPDIPGLKRVADLALAQKLEARPFIPSRDGNRFDKVAKSKLRIGGIACKIHAMETLHKPAHNSDQRYGRVQLSRSTVEEAEVHIFVFLSEDAEQNPFIIPKEALLKHLLKDKDRGCLSIPTYLDRTKRRTAMLDAYDYRGRWNHIRFR